MKQRILKFILGILIAIVINSILYTAFSIGYMSFDMNYWDAESRGMFAFFFALVTIVSLIFTQFIEDKP